ncbi:hypothetical protein [Halorussus marinus]|uniref:hypothetical protein n=1 Tax=Halorussus marinus TaxID=2505976 RepID=UPI00106E0F05|nr:hypothetical protein [Halorussus marinus]
MVTREPRRCTDLAIDSYRWSTPLDVIDADDLVEWETPFADGWWTHTIRLKSTDIEYDLEYSSIPDPARVELYTFEDEERCEKRGDVQHLAVIEEDYVLICGTTTNRGDVSHRPDPDNPGQPACQYASMNDMWFRKQPEVLGDGWSLCEACDSDAETDSDDGSTMDVDVKLPDRLTPEDVEDAVDEHRQAHGMAKLGDVADALELSVGRMRTVLVALDLYGEHVREVYRPKGGGRQ